MALHSVRYRVEAVALAHFQRLRVLRLLLKVFSILDGKSSERLQWEVQLTDTPIFAIFDKVSVNSQMSVNFKTLRMSFFWSKSHLYLSFSA